jgi:hypothetical protein
MKARLYNLSPGEKFIWKNNTYSVLQHDSGMVEVHGNGRAWAWNNTAVVTLATSYRYR